MRKSHFLLALAIPLCLAGCPDINRDEPVPIAPPLVFGFVGPLQDTRYFAKVDDTFNVTVFHPVAEHEITDAPLIVFNVGWNAIRNTYESYCIQLAQWGYVCVIRYYPSLGILGLGQDLFEDHVAHSLRVISWAEEENQNPDSPIFGMVDTGNIGIIGHSLGGSVSLVAAPMHPAVRAVVSLDAVYDAPRPDRAYDFANLLAPVMYVKAGVTSLCSQAPGANLDLFANTFQPKYQVTITGADHMDFMEDPPDSPDSQDAGNLFCDTGSIDPDETRIIAHRYAIPFFNVFLKGETEFETWFRGEEAAADVAAGIVTIDDQLDMAP
jgi:dienelactone hydrolase